MARSCAALDDNNKDNVCKPNIPAGIKCPPPSKTISLIARFGANSTWAKGRGEATAGESVLATPLWGMLFADDARAVSQSPEQLMKMMGVIVVVWAAFGLTVSEGKTEIMCLRAKGMSESTMSTCPSRSTGGTRGGTRGETFHMTKWIAAAKARAGLRHGVICPNVTGRTKEKIAQSKRTRAGSPAIVD